MQVSTSRKKEKDSEGNVKEILTKTFHCETCSAFVRSEHIEGSEDDPGG